MSTLLLASLSLVISVATSTFEYQKNSENYPSSLKPIVTGISALQRSRDRRTTTHWESRTNSKLDDDRTGNDRDEGRRRISYPPLGYSRRTEQSVKLSDAIDVTAANFDDDMRLDNDCVSRKPIVLVSFGDAKKTLDDVINLQKSQAYGEIFGTVKCRRRRIDGWKVEEPIYVEEPGWIVIDLDPQTNQRQSINDQDPFYVARGKRSVSLSSLNIDDNLKNNIKNNSINKINITNDKNNLRIKRQNFEKDSRMRSLIEDDGSGKIPGLLIRKNNANGYMQLRDKHSDILDILNEPFFISRGKKNSLRMGLYEWNKRYVKNFDNIHDRKVNLDENYFSRDSRSEINDKCESITGECSMANSRSEIVVDSSPYRDRRGVMEDLLKETDPFYVARGKRSVNNKQTTLTKSDSNDNSSVSIKH